MHGVICSFSEFIYRSIFEGVTNGIINDLVVCHLPYQYHNCLHTVMVEVLGSQKVAVSKLITAKWH